MQLYGKSGSMVICYDSRRRHFYENIKDKTIGLIVFPHGSPADPKKDADEISTNDYLCNTYADAFDVPVVYINSIIGYDLDIIEHRCKKDIHFLRG